MYVFLKVLDFIQLIVFIYFSNPEFYVCEFNYSKCSCVIIFLLDGIFCRGFINAIQDGLELTLLLE